MSSSFLEYYQSFFLALTPPAKMVKRSKLLQTLDFHKGRDYDAEKRKKVAKAAEKKKVEKKRKRVEAGEADEDEDEVFGLPFTVEDIADMCWNPSRK